MKRLIATTAITTIALAGAVFAEGDLSRANVTRVAMEMGTTDDGDMYFKPNHFEFETGKAYSWALTNVDGIKHELAINEMREKIFTRKIEIAASDGELVAEIKGDINEVEVGPGQTVEWFFVPVQDAEEIQIACEIPGHFDAGMFGTVILR